MCPTERAATCSPIVVASNNEFLLRNQLKQTNFIWGELDGGGQLDFIVENLPKDGTGCPGYWMFDEMMGHFGPAVIAIHGNWTYGDNLTIVNALMAGGSMTLESAALQTITGRYAKRYNYGNVRVISESNAAGKYLAVQVLFTH